MVGIAFTPYLILPCRFAQFSDSTSYASPLIVMQPKIPGVLRAGLIAPVASLYDAGHAAECECVIALFQFNFSPTF
jgi:hypothetical protein